MTIFNINVTFSRLHGVVWFSQAISMPAFVRLVILAFRFGKPWQLKVTKAFFIFYSFWNLEPFHSITPDICLNVSTLQAFTLEYLIALYPFVLILLTYFLIKLHDRNNILLVATLKPFQMVLSTLRQSWNIQTSIIDSFATFFLLSYVKILSVTVDLLAPTHIYKLGSNISLYGLYYLPSVPYFGHYHHPNAILAITIVTLFVTIPTITLVLYPFRLFQKFLSLIPINWHFLHAFVDSFQGCYKDGTEPKTLDCRWFSGSMLLIRLMFSSTFSAIYFIYTLIVLLLLLIAFINIQPFKPRLSSIAGQI